MKAKTYHVFLLFAKATTSETATNETYDIFVGKDAVKSTVLNSVQSERTKIPSTQIKFIDNEIAWPDAWKKDYNPITCILTCRGRHELQDVHNGL